MIFRLPFIVSLVMLLANRCCTSAFKARTVSDAMQRNKCFSSANTRLMAQKEATVGMGCFWSPQEKFDGIAGITDSKAGYSGGENTNPNYKTVCAGDGHIEAVRLEYDDEKVSYDEILDVFFDREVNAFGNGMGQYQSIIWTETVEQKEIAEKRLQSLVAKSDPRARYVTIREKEPFYVAETYHQKYNKKQFPKYIVLGLAFLLDVIPGLPPDAYKVGFGLTMGYIAITLGERAVDGFGKLKRID